jgi:hypothetical protein
MRKFLLRWYRARITPAPWRSPYALSSTPTDARQPARAVTRRSTKTRLSGHLFNPPQQPAAYRGWRAWQQEMFGVSTWFRAYQDLLLLDLLPGRDLAALSRGCFLRSGRSFAGQLSFVSSCDRLVYLGQAALAPTVIRFCGAAKGSLRSIVRHLACWTAVRLARLGVTIYLGKPR